MRAAVSSGANGRAMSASASAPSVCSARKSPFVRPSAKITFSIESSSHASVSGVTATCSNWRAVSDRRGSTATTRPPRLTISCSCSRMRGAVSTDPCDTIGFAPIMNRKRVRLRSGIGTTSGLP